MTETAIGHQVAIAAILVYVLQFLKSRNWFPWLNQNSALANRIASIIGALIAAVGISMSVTGNLDLGGTLTISFPSWQAMVTAAGHFASQMALQEGFYQSIFNKRPAA